MHTPLYKERSIRKALLGTGISLIFISLIGDYIGIGSGGFGSGQKTVLVAGLAMLAAIPALRSKNLYFKYWYSVMLATSLLISWQFYFYPIGGYNWNLFLQTSVRKRAMLYAHIFVIFLTIILAVIIFQSAKRILGDPKKRAVLVGSNIMFFSSIVLCGVGLEIGSMMMVPPWPARDLRAKVITKEAEGNAKELTGNTGHMYNSWGVRDKERTIEKPAGYKRIIFLGDSFLEGGFLNNTLPGYAQDILVREGRHNIECVNLGVSATGPVHYLYKMRNIGTKLSPDGALLFIYTGNDFLQPQEAYGIRRLKLIEECPIPSLLGNIMPNFTWLLVNRLGLSESAKNNIYVPDEIQKLKAISKKPYEKGIKKLAEHMHRYYFPKTPISTLEEILARKGPSFWDTLSLSNTEIEYLSGWRMNLLITLNLPGRPQKEYEHVSDDCAEPTASYIKEIAKDLKEDNIFLIVFLIPEGTNVDPEYRNFWKPWKNVHTPEWYDANRRKLFSILKENKIAVIDLGDVLDGVPNTYRKMDGHWTEKGHEIVAKRVSRTIMDYL